MTSAVMTSRFALLRRLGSRSLLVIIFILLPALHPVSAQIDERFSFEFRNVPLDNALFQISRVTDTDIIYESHLTTGIKVSEVYREELLGSILYNLLQPLGLEARRIRTGMYVVRYTLRRELEPVTELSGGITSVTPRIRDKDRIQNPRPPGPLRDRPLFRK